jgi:Phage integrase, N-terminal SAM-like domain
MPTRRSRGEGSLYWDESRQRWMAAVDVGFSPTGKRQRRWVSGKTKTEAKQKLLAMRRDQSDGLPTEHRTYTVREAVESWLEHGLTGRDDHTVTNRTILAQTHVIPALGSRRLVDLTPEEVDAWLAAKSETLSTDTLHRLLSTCGAQYDGHRRRNSCGGMSHCYVRLRGARKADHRSR